MKSNVQRLAIRRMSVLGIPPGGGHAAALSLLTDAPRMAAVYREAHEWTAEAIRVFKTAPDNPFGDDDEAIAGFLLEKIEESSN